jgi:D-alanyl-D-alanine carboxypeptidase
VDEADHYSSPHDLALMAAYAYQNYPLLAQVVATKTYTIYGSADHKAFFPENFNRLLGTYPGAVGFKTGFTDSAGYCVVSGAHRGGRTLIAVVLGDPTAFNDSTALLDYGFRRAL